MNKKAAVASLALLCGAALSASAVDLGAPTSGTPYDAYMSPVKRVMGSLQGGEPSMERVRELVREAYDFRYSFDEPYVATMPAVTAATRTGDCKAKSLWLCNEMNDRNVRFVVGKARSTSQISHAWVMWKNQGRWWILDPTNVSVPIAADRVSKDAYIPSYSWGRSGVYRHAGKSLMTTTVAGPKRRGFLR